MSLHTNLHPCFWKAERVPHPEPPNERWIVWAHDTGDIFVVNGGPFNGSDGVITAVRRMGWYERPTLWWRFKRYLRHARETPSGCEGGGRTA